MWSGSALFSSGESGTPRMNGNVHKLPVVRATRHKEGHCASRCQCKPLQNHPEISFLTSENGVYCMPISPVHNVVKMIFKQPSLRARPVTRKSKRSSEDRKS